jgi:4-amino-4-deoxy-L-arabinose transferase-like glycosyltransferase
LSARQAWIAAAVIAAAFFVASAPTLAWLEFSSTMENLTVATALEIRRSGHWLLPTLEGEPRVAKPPLAAWIAAASIRPATFAHLDDPDPIRRDRAYESLAWDFRWTALFTSCLMLLAVFDLGKTIAGAPIGLISMIACGSSLYLLRFGRQATTDVQLALWVVIANAALARLLLIGNSWRGAIFLGIALGLALMSKGPVALLQTLLPACVFTLWRGKARPSIPQLTLALLLAIAVGGAWYFFVWIQVPEVWQRWSIELARSAPTERSDNPLSYASIFLYMLPWTPVLIHGAIWTLAEAWRARRGHPLSDEGNGMTLALLLVIVPLVVMSFFPDRKERYLLPLAGPAAVLAARGLGAMLDSRERRRIPTWVHWATIAIIAVAFPIAGATVLKRLGGGPWYPPRLAACLGVAVVMLLLIFILQSRRHPFAAVIGPAVIMLVLQPIFFFGYRDTREGRAEMRPLASVIREVAPNALMYNWRPDAPKRADVSLSIYLNRPTVWIADPAKLPSLDRPQVMITQQKRDPPVRRPPPGWMPLATVPHDKDYYQAFIREPALEVDLPSTGFAPPAPPH